MLKLFLLRSKRRRYQFWPGERGVLRDGMLLRTQDIDLYTDNFELVSRYIIDDRDISVVRVSQDMKWTVQCHLGGLERLEERGPS